MEQKQPDSCSKSSSMLELGKSKSNDCRIYRGSSPAVMAAIYNESEHWLKLDWVTQKLEGRWDKSRLSSAMPFFL
jgi:hypothetical protein